MLPNGDIVVAGIVRLENDTIAPYWNIGLVRYTPQGFVRPWTASSSPYFWHFSEYVVYPNLANGGSGDALIESIEDIAYAEGKIYVLVTRVFGGVERDAAVVVFNEDGSFQQNLSVIASSADEYARALEVSVTGLVAKPVSVTILAERYAPGPAWSSPSTTSARTDCWPSTTTSTAACRCSSRSRRLAPAATSATCTRATSRARRAVFPAMACRSTWSARCSARAPTGTTW
ncbi:hypothetical protein [Dokdonella sp.]|uniref:hypothetical protein n=1 Tax=Dokdonella sp. TaxID=2291710 RepID=UPI0025C30D5F|nr:hypothetical protein [Dokdonella sp.]MBX3693032.1 hypothetical protein [Dokdonella sp.]